MGLRRLVHPAAAANFFRTRRGQSLPSCELRLRIKEATGCDGSQAD
jgi:hypothetical protein